ncbi:nucleotidyltransferase domain-containing protein [Pseudomonas frederiksbergensis]|uniref:nucleotidyltransferase domain-containing protein n=1 Tax=Pseudomonas frederiksbergensis TaxID=104087 RepID=UPI003D1F389A
MRRNVVITTLREMADRIGIASAGSEWYLFGSVARDDPRPSDIDLMILCVDDAQADALRKAIDPEAFSLPIHLCLLRFDEAYEVNAIEVQRAEKIFP